MKIDWFVIVAQIINFFIILFILQKLLYKPVVTAMEERQVRIQKSQKEADEKLDHAEELIYEYNGKIAGIDKEKREILENAREQAQVKKESLIDGYKTEAEVKRAAYLKEIEDEKQTFITNLSRSLGENAVKIASHILDTISSKELEDEVFNTFTKNIKNIKEELPDDSILKEESTLDVYSSRDLSSKEKDTIESLLRGQLVNLKNINFERDESLVLGHELDLETYTFHTNIKNYLENIEKDILKNLETN